MINRSSVAAWGPSAWNFLHAFSYAYPQVPTSDDRENAYLFLVYFARAIPCERCRRDFESYLSIHLTQRGNSPPFASRLAVTQFMVDAHNYVSEKLGKRTYTYSMVDAMYTHRARSNASRMFVTAVILLIILLTTTRLAQR